MRIPCPFCGERDSSEFTYLGDADSTRPDPTQPDAPARFVEAVYLRISPAGAHRELWYHAFGCRGWLRVTRDTRTHQIIQAAFAGECYEEKRSYA
jgi:heterotetrameric sarcosine oxidase delta subunit